MESFYKLWLRKLEQNIKKHGFCQENIPKSNGMLLENEFFSKKIIRKLRFYFSSIAGSTDTSV